MIRMLYDTPDHAVRTDLDLKDLDAILQAPGGLLWLDLSDEPAAVCRPILQETFGFHPLAVDDALEESHSPKIDDWGEYLCIVLHAVAPVAPDRGQMKTLEVDLFLGESYLITHRTQPVAAIERLWAACQRDERHMQRGVVRLLYELADELVADYMPVIEQFDEALDRVEGQMFQNPSSALLEQLFALKRGLLTLRRIIAPQREVLNKLARGDYALIPGEHRIFFRDVYDHLVRLHDISESLRDLLGGVLDTYLSVINNRMNEVMKTLTLITTLFMPVSFLTGFFGMNFFQAVAPRDAWTGPVAFALTLAAMFLVPVGMYLWIRRRAWM